MKKAKKFAMLMGAAMLVCIISVVGTLAYLSAKTTELTNTFVAAGAGDLFEKDPGDGLFLKEHTVTRNDETGEYTLDSGDSKLTTGGVSYEAIPGATLPKDPVLSAVGKTDDVPAYVYLEVIDSTNGAITYTLGSDWSALMDGANQVKHNGNPIYVYKTGAKVVADFSSQILSGDTVTVANDNSKVAGLSTGKTLKFNGYMCQSTTFADATAAFNAVFNA